MLFQDKQVLVGASKQRLGCGSCPPLMVSEQCWRKPQGHEGDEGMGEGVVTRNGSEDIAPGLDQEFLAVLGLAFCACSCILGYRLSRYLYRETFR